MTDSLVCCRPWVQSWPRLSNWATTTQHGSPPHCREPAHEIPPMTRSRGENLTGKADQVFRDSQKLPPALTLKMISVFLMLASTDYSLISVTLAEGLPHLFPNKDQFRTLISKFPRWWYFMRLSRGKGVFQFKLICRYFSLTNAFMPLVLICMIAYIILIIK